MIVFYCFLVYNFLFLFIYVASICTFFLVVNVFLVDLFYLSAEFALNPTFVSRILSFNTVYFLRGLFSHLRTFGLSDLTLIFKGWNISINLIDCWLCPAMLGYSNKTSLGHNLLWRIEIFNIFLIKSVWHFVEIVVICDQISARWWCW